MKEFLNVVRKSGLSAALTVILFTACDTAPRYVYERLCDADTASKTFLSCGDK